MSVDTRNRSSEAAKDFNAEDSEEVAESPAIEAIDPVAEAAAAQEAQDSLAATEILNEANEAIEILQAAQGLIEAFQKKAQERSVADAAVYLRRSMRSRPLRSL